MSQKAAMNEIRAILFSLVNMAGMASSLQGLG